MVVQGASELGPKEDLHKMSVLLCERVGMPIAPIEVSVAHRLGKYNGGKPRPVIIKFTRRCVKSCLMRNKYKLKHVQGWEGVYVEESLTGWRREFVRCLKEDKELNRVSTVDGKIIFNKGPKTYELNTGDDFINVLDYGILSQETLSNAGINPSLAVKAE